MKFSELGTRSEDRVIAALKEYLDRIDPSCGYSDWFRVLAGIFYETRGTETGFELADSWSRGGSNYRGTADVRKQWKYLRRDVARPITIKTLARMARQGVSVTTFTPRYRA